MQKHMPWGHNKMNTINAPISVIGDENSEDIAAIKSIKTSSNEKEKVLKRWKCVNHVNKRNREITCILR